MKKILKIMKKCVSLFILFAFGINSFAAIVSDNDGSAFVSKAEFESLKNNFSNQIEQYNTSIDSKIDGAIAQYLAGINLSKETFYNVEVSEWEKVLQTNYSLTQTWRMPSINLVFSYTYAGNNYNGQWWETWWTTAAIKYDKPKTTYQVRNCVNAGQESNTYTLPDNAVWVGQSADYEDRINGIKTAYPKNVYDVTPRTGTNEAGRYFAGAGLGQLSVIKALDMKSGHLKSDTVKNIWKATVHYYSSEATSAQFNSDIDPDNIINNSLSSSIVLNYVNNKQYNNEHIITWDNYNWSQLSDPNWSHCLGKNPSYTQQSMLTNSSVSKTGKWSVMELSDASQTAGSWTNRTDNSVRIRPKLAQNFSAYYSGAYQNQSTESVRSVGVLDKTYASTSIYQWDKKRTLKRNEKQSLEKINLCNGVLIAYVKTDEIFKWEPVITGTYKNGTTDTPITKWRVKLSKKPFLTKDSVPAATDVLKNKGQTEDYLVTDTSTGKCKFEFELGEDTVIFCKWWPDDTTICNTKEWQGTLDLTQCGTYSIRAS